MRLYELAAARYPDTRGRCVSCGFFGKHKADWREVGAEHRADGWLYDNEPGGGFNPACIRGAADLGREFFAKLEARREARQKAGESDVDAEGNPNPKPPSTEALLLEVLNLDRRCSEWYPYTSGFSPKEHVEELRMMQLEEDRRKHDMELANLQVRAQADSRAISESLVTVAERTERFTGRWTYAAFGVAVVALLVVVANYIFPALGPAIGHWINPAWAPSAKP